MLKEWKKILEYTVWCLVAAWAAGIWLPSWQARLPLRAAAVMALSKLVLRPSPTAMAQTRDLFLELGHAQ
jgi:hypothetical protein